jgi:uncharacterized protein YbjT (DUF2867 family)
LVAQLIETQMSVRAVTRRPDVAGLPAGVEVVFGDVEDPTSLDAVFSGIDRAFLMSAQAVGSQPHPTHDLLLARAAAKAGVAHLVKLSVLNGGSGDDIIARWSREAEAAVVDSGVPWTLLRPGRFMTNALVWAGMIRAGDTVTMPFAHRPAASIDPADIAAVARLALTTDGHEGRAYELSGPEELRPADELRILGNVLGRDLKLVDMPDDAARAAMVAGGTPAEVVDAIVRRVGSDDSGRDVLPTVQQLLGRPPNTFEQWATANDHQFRPTQ